LEPRLTQARQLEQSGQVLQAEWLYATVLKEWPHHVEATRRLAQLALQRGDVARAVHLLDAAARAHPSEPQLGLDMAFAHLAAARPKAAVTTLESTLARAPGFYLGWMVLGEVR
jgi:predicted Zn-dependent protease